MDLDDLTFTELVCGAPGTILVAFGLPALLSSRELTKSLVRVAAAFHGRALVHHVQVAAQPSLARHCRVETLPTVLVFRDGSELGRLEGARPEHHYHLALASALEAPAGAELLAAAT
jgi:thioredoxin 1